MPEKLSGTASIKTIYATCTSSFKNHPILLSPFAISACLQGLALFVLYLFPRQPVNFLFRIPIRTFWGEQFLHYPANFLLLPKLFFLTNEVLNVIFGAFLSTVAIVMFLEIYNHKRPHLKKSLRICLKKYFSIFTIVFLITLLNTLLRKIIQIGLYNYFASGFKNFLFFSPRIIYGPFFFIIYTIITFLLLCLFAYALPILIIESAKIRTCLVKSVVFFKKSMLATFIIVGIPMLIFMPILLLMYKSSYLMQRLFPEVVAVILALNIALASLVVDPLITISATILYLLRRESQ